MAMLDQLKLAEASPKKDRTPLGRCRRRLADALELQIELAKSDSAGTALSRTRRRWVKNDIGGKELREVPVRVRRWWWRDDAGTTFVAMKHGARVLEIAPGKKAIEVGPADELPSKLAILRQAVIAGELDGAIGSLAATREPPKKKVGNTAAKAPPPKGCP